MTDWYTASGNPTQGSAGASNVLRSEYNSISAAFSKMPALTGYGGLLVGVNSSGTALQTYSYTEVLSALNITALNNVSIGAITPSTGAFTTLSASNLTYTGALTGGTGVVNIGSGQIYKDSSGNVGIGTSSPIAPLDVHGASGILGQFFETTSGNACRIRFSNSGAVNTIESTAGSGSTSLAIAVDGSERMRIDSSGNLGLGVTPKTSTGSYVAFEFGQSGYLAAVTSGAGIQLASNTYVAAGSVNRYSTTGAATYYGQSGGIHSWHNAPSGTAGNAISFTQAMTLDTSGNLGIGTSSPSAKLDINGTLRVSGDSSFTSTGAVLLSKGTTAERPTGVAGKVRFNTTLTQFEGYNGTSWGNIGGGATRAWVNFNGVTTATVLASFNVSSVTRLNTGYYQINFTNALTDSNYSVAGMAQDTMTGYSSNCPSVCISSSDLTPKSVSQLKIDVVEASGANYMDSPNVCVSIFGN